MNDIQKEKMKADCIEYINTLNRKIVLTWVLKNGLLNQNTKLSKGKNNNYGLELLPADFSGTWLCLKNQCGECSKICIFQSNPAAIYNAKKYQAGEGLDTATKAKCKRTWLYLNDRKMFDKILNEEIKHLSLLSELEDKKMAVRFNVFSDLNFNYIAKKHPTIQAYDYTKNWDKKPLKNYHLTYSFNENKTVDDVKTMTKKGHNIAMVFIGTIPTFWNNIPVISGDDHDERYNDVKGVIIGLKAKSPLMSGDKTEKAKNGFIAAAAKLNKG